MLLIPRLAAIRELKGVIKVILFLLVVLGGTYTYADDNELEINAVTGEIDKSLEATFNSLFERSNVLNVAYVPNVNLGSRLLDKADLFDAWRYNFSYRCVGSCRDVAVDINRFFWKAFLLEKECPKPYSVAITFKKNEKSIQSVFINNTGRCFTINGASYFVTEGNIFDFLQKNTLYPSLTSTMRGK
jgi:hypothetical protein